jgi:hypothetical protein
VRNIFKKIYILKILLFLKKKRAKKELKINKNPPKSPFCRNIFEKEYFIKNSLVFEKKRPKNQLKSTNIPQIAIL